MKDKPTELVAAILGMVSIGREMEAVHIKRFRAGIQ
jgi:hypothetical protein